MSEANVKSTKVRQTSCVNDTASRSFNIGDINHFVMLTIKNDKASEAQFIRVADYIMELVRSSTILNYEIEFGKQGKKHIHMIIKLDKPFNLVYIKKAYHRFKNKKVLKYKEIHQANPYSQKMIILTYKLKLLPFNWKITPFNDLSHLSYCLDYYLRKEQETDRNSPQFID
jgi:hypothetical protein